MSQLALAVAIFLLTLTLVLARPRGLDNGLAATLGAGLALVAGVVSWADVRHVVGIVWNATLALIGIIVISVLLDQAGFFRWAALHLARWAGGDGRRLLIYIILLGAFVSTFFTNDSTVLILTPIVYELLKALGITGRGALPYLMACGFIADAMSIPLSVSNLTNIIAADFFDLSFARFAGLMLLPAAATLAASLAALLWYYRRETPATCDSSALADPRLAVDDRFLFLTGIAVLLGMVVFFFAGHRLGVPASAVMGTGAALLLLATRVNRVVQPWRVLRRAPWGVVVFSLGMYLVVFGMGKAGLTAASARLLGWLAGHGALAAVTGTGALVAVFSSLMNNLPGIMVGALAVAAAPVAGNLREGMILASVIGSDIGPKLTPIGSLATLIWLHLLRLKGVAISPREYLRMGLAVTPPVLAVALLALWAAVTLAAP